MGPDMDQQKSRRSASLTALAPAPVPLAGMVGLHGRGARGQSAELHAIRGGLKPSARPGDQQEVGGIGNMLSDAADVVGTAVGNAVGSTAAALTGIGVSQTDTLAASWSPHGQFAWDVGFSVSGGTAGWIVQEIKNTFGMTDASGTAVAIGGTGVVPLYYEAWAVDAAGAVSPSAGATNDMWRRPGRGDNTKGHWSMQGKVYFTTTDPATKGLTPGGVSNAGILLSSTGSPGGLGTARLHRYAHGTWDSTTATKTHTGSAG